MKAALVKFVRTEHAKHIRRLYGDNSGMCRFADRLCSIGGGVSNAVTTVEKDNLIVIWRTNL